MGFWSSLFKELNGTGEKQIFVNDLPKKKELSEYEKAELKVKELNDNEKEDRILQLYSRTFQLDMVNGHTYTVSANDITIYEYGGSPRIEVRKADITMLEGSVLENIVFWKIIDSKHIRDVHLKRLWYMSYCSFSGCKSEDIIIKTVDIE